jgi:predicted glycosyltransferase
MPVMPQKLVPTSVTEVPPVEGPEAGDTAVTVGGGSDGSGSIVNTSESALAPLPQVQV